MSLLVKPARWPVVAWVTDCATLDCVVTRVSVKRVPKVLRAALVSLTRPATLAFSVKVVFAKAVWVSHSALVTATTAATKATSVSSPPAVTQPANPAKTELIRPDATVNWTANVVVASCFA